MALSLHNPATESANRVVGRAPAWLDVEQKIQRASQTGRCTVLITGPQGTGKEVVARELHQRSPRQAKPFTVVDCSTVSTELLTSELFGHRRGSFTGADANKAGLLASAEGGTAFLDEIGELDLHTQARLLRFLQDHEVRQVGSETYKPLDVRVVAATNRDLKSEIAAGRFRSDLYDRLNVVHICMPTLAERREDIPLLIDCFLRRYCELEKVQYEPLDEDGIQMLMACKWTGNVRQLEKFIERYCVFGANRRELQGLVREEFGTDETPLSSVDTAPDNLDELRRWKVAQVMAKVGNKKTAAALALGITRGTLERYLKEIALTIPK